MLKRAFAMKIVVINLERSTDRLAFMQAQFDSLGLRAEYFKAIDASRGDLDGLSRYDERKALRILGHPLSPGEVGCFASHYLLWKRCAASGEPLVIMEDDVRMRPGFVRALALAEHEIERCRFLRIAGLFRRRFHTIARLDSEHSLIRFLKGPYGLQCYALSPAGAQRLVDHASIWINAVDTYVDQFWEHGLASFAIVPFHLSSGSDETPPTTIGQARYEIQRSWHRSVRRNLTQLWYRMRRAAFNFRFNPQTLPPP